MAPRKKLPDVMGELLGGNAHPTPMEKAGKPVNREDSLPVKPQEGLPASQQDGEKVKATYYLSPQTVDTLEEAKLRLRRLMRKEKRALSSSAIVDAALQLAFADLETSGAESRLAGILERQ